MRFSAVVKRLPPPFLPGSWGHGKAVGRLVKNVSVPFVPDHSTPKEHTGGYGEHADYNRPKLIAQERRRAWARFGQKRSNVHVMDLFPSIEEYEAEMQAEKQWWKDVESSKKSLARFEEIKAQKKLHRDEKIASAMSQMPQWVAQFKSADLEPTPKPIPSVRIRSIELKKRKTDHYVREMLSKEEMVMDIAGRKLDPRSQDFKAIQSRLQTTKKSKKKQKGGS